MGEAALASPAILREAILALVPRSESLASCRVSDVSEPSVRFLAVVHRSGEATPLWDRLLPMLRQAGAAAIVEYNHFGYADRGGASREIDLTLCVSIDALRRHWIASGCPPLETYLPTHRVLYNPVLLPTPEDDAPGMREEARAALGIPASAFVLGWVGRPDPRRIDAMLPAILPRLARAIPSLHLLTRRFPDSLASWCESVLAAGPDATERVPPSAEAAAFGARRRYRNLPLTADETELRRTYAAMDVLVHFSSMGESFGMTIAEAMRCGVPVVTHRTPGSRRRNGQAELVRDSVTGFLADDPLTAFRRIEALAASPELRMRLGAEARRRMVEPPFSAISIRDQFESELARLVRAAGSPLPFPELPRLPAEAEVARFLRDRPGGEKITDAPAGLRDRLWAAQVEVRRWAWRIRRRWL